MSGDAFYGRKRNDFARNRWKNVGDFTFYFRMPVCGFGNRAYFYASSGRRKSMKRSIYLCIGFLSLALGAIGAVLPLLPTVPFLMLAAICFGKSSERLHTWFTSTKLYKENLESYVEGKGMSVKTKVRIMITVTILMSIGFVMMHRVPVGRIVLGIVWIFHVFYFVFGVKTLEPDTQL
jgi:hypothetical protein